MEHSALQAGATNRIRMAPELINYLAESLGIEPQSRVNAWHVSTVLACHLPRSSWHRDEDSNPMRLVWEASCSPRNTPAKNLAEGRRFELLCPCGAAVFGTAGLPIGHTLRI